MITQETIGRKFTYGMNSSTKDKRKPWKPPGPLIAVNNTNSISHGTLSSSSTSSTTAEKAEKATTLSTTTHSHGHQFGRSLSSVSTSTSVSAKGEY